MPIEIKKSVKPVKYNLAINELEKRLLDIESNKKNELIWLLEHETVFTGGTSHKESEILDKTINFVKTNRGGKITCHNPGQLVCYFVIDLRKRGKNIRKLLETIEQSIILTLKYYNIESKADRKNIGIWYQNKNELEKVAAIGIKVKKWIAYHGFAINISNNLMDFKKIIPCGIENKKVTNLNEILKQDYSKINNILITNLLGCLENLTS